MRILRLRFKNINSIKGNSPEIDFESGILGNSGVFAITGPTGSGKTSILDAISVALYGRTPRLESGTNIGNLMSRHTGESFSEVEFEAKGKT